LTGAFVGHLLVEGFLSGLWSLWEKPQPSFDEPEPSGATRLRPLTEAALHAWGQVVEKPEKPIEGEGSHSRESDNHHHPFAFGK
jgi:hypothetical protein